MINQITKLLPITILILAFAIVVSGQDDDMIEIVPPYGEIVGEPTEETWLVAHFTRDCVGVGPMTCMQVKQSAEDSWQNFYGNIANFAYVEGFAYELRVINAELTDVPADASTRFIQLVEIMSKHPVNPVLGREWLLETMNGEALSAETEITLTFAEDDNLNGSGGCNSYFATFTVDDTQVSIGAIGSTRMMCAAGMETETTYFATLEQATTYYIDGSQLTLMNDAGDTLLVFTVR